MQLIHDSLGALKLGVPQVHLNLAVFPLLGPDEGAPGYLLLDEALSRRLAQVTEISAGGSVPELEFENSSAEKILLVDGDELVGAKQNRVVNVSILIGGGRKIVIPVSCVEQGRWFYRTRHFGTANRTLFAKARAKKMTRVSQSLRERGDRFANQSEIWEDVSEKAAAFRSPSATMAMGDIYDSRRKGLEEYCKAFRAEPRQRGAVAAIDGRVVGLELFDSSATFSCYLEKLVKSYALDALETVDARSLAPAAPEVERFLGRIRTAAAETFVALGEGEDVRLTGEGVAGGALMSEGRLVHLAGFAVAP